MMKSLRRCRLPRHLRVLMPYWNFCGIRRMRATGRFRISTAGLRTNSASAISTRFLPISWLWATAAVKSSNSYISRLTIRTAMMKSLQRCRLPRHLQAPMPYWNFCGIRRMRATGRFRISTAGLRTNSASAISTRFLPISWLWATAAVKSSNSYISRLTIRTAMMKSLQRCRLPRHLQAPMPYWNFCATRKKARVFTSFTTG